MCRQAKAAAGRPHRPSRGTSASTIRGQGSSERGTRTRADGVSLGAVWVAMAHRLIAAPRSGPLLGVAMAVPALAGTLAQLSHGGIAGAQPGPGELDWTSGAIAACSTLPLVAWRRAPAAVFAFTASAVVLLAGL